MNNTIQHQLSDLFRDVYKILSEKEDCRTNLETALDGIVRELREERPQRRNETISEMRGVERMLSNFDPTTSPALPGIVHHFGIMPSRSELYSIAQVIHSVQPTATAPLTRTHKRRKLALLQWFDAHWDAIEPTLSQIDFES
jgi:hypothetical protein